MRLPHCFPVRRVVGRRVGSALFAVMATAAVVIVETPEDAYACGMGCYWSMKDDLNSSPQSRWSYWINGSGSGGFTTWINGIGPSGFGTPGTNTWGWATKNDTNGWSEIGRDVTTNAMGSGPHCEGSVWLKASALTGPSTVNIEVINPTDWTYLSLRQVSVSGNHFQRFDIGPWYPNPKTVRFRVSLLGSGSYRYLGVDDLAITCEGVG